MSSRAQDFQFEAEALSGLLVESTFLSEIDTELAKNIVSVIYDKGDFRLLENDPQAQKPGADSDLGGIYYDLDQRGLPQIPERLLRLALTYRPMDVDLEWMVERKDQLPLLAAFQDDPSGDHDELFDAGGPFPVMKLAGLPTWAAWPRMMWNPDSSESEILAEAPLAFSWLANASTIQWTPQAGLLADGIHFGHSFTRDQRAHLRLWERGLKVHQAITSATVDLSSDPNGPMISSMTRGARPVPPLALREQINVVYGSDQSLLPSYALSLAAAAEAMGERVYITDTGGYFGRVNAATKKVMRGGARLAPAYGTKLDALVEKLGPGDTLVIWHRDEGTGPAIQRAIARGVRVVVNMFATQDVVEAELEELRIGTYGGFAAVPETAGLPAYVGYDVKWLAKHLNLQRAVPDWMDFI